MIQELSFKLNDDFVTIFFEINDKTKTANIASLNFAGCTFEQEDLKEVSFEEIPVSLLKTLKNENPVNLDQILNITKEELIEILRKQVKGGDKK